MKHSKVPAAAACVCALLLFVACMPGSNTASVIVSETAKPAGFLLGLWHGVIAIVSFVVSLFNKNVNVYEVYNNGWPYNLGFVLGLMIAFGGGAKGSCSGKKNKRC